VFEHRVLMAEGKHLGAELYIGARSNEHEVAATAHLDEEHTAG